MTREDLIEKIRKVEALYTGTDSLGEKQAAGTALERLKAQLAAAAEPLTEFKISIGDPWKSQLFIALCRRNNIQPYRHPHQRRGTIMLRTTSSMLNQILWPQFLELEKLLHSYLNEATQDIITRGVHGDLSDAEERQCIAGD